jgi:hypothetical protein
MFMSLFAWSQDVPIDADAYADVIARMGDAKMPGLIAHVVIEQPDRTLRYIDVWESERACDEAFEAVVHPAVHPVLMARGVRVNGEPPRTPLKVIDVRFGDGSSVRG